MFNMKKLIVLSLSVLLIPFAGFRARPGNLPESIVEVRAGTWPISLERNADGVGTYSLIYRNQEIMDGMSLDTLTFPNLDQLKYFAKGLDALKIGHNGDIANYKDYSLSRADKKLGGIWYLLRYQWGSTSFQQPEADIMGKTIKGL